MQTLIIVASQHHGCDLLEDTCAVNEDVAPVLHNLARHDILSLDIPDTFLVVPCSTFELMLQLDVAVKVVLFRDSFEVGKDLIPGGVAKILSELGSLSCAHRDVLAGPVRVGFPRKLIVMRRNIACAARVSIFC